LELGALIALFALTGNLEGNLGIASFVVLFSIAFHHYDNLYRSMQNEEKPRWLSWLGLTVPGRLLILVSVLMLGIDLEIAAAYFLTVTLLLSSIQWVLKNSHRTKA
jgi:hypothetical protein